MKLFFTTHWRRLTQIARERFPEAFPGAESLAALASRVLVFQPRTSQELMRTLEVRRLMCGWARA